MKRVLRINGHLITLADHLVRDLEAKVAGKRKPKLQRAADRAWENLAKTVAEFQPKPKGGDHGFL